MLSKLRAFAADPCGALADIARRADVLERAEPDDTRRTAPTRRASLVRTQMGATLCPALEQLGSPVRLLASKVALARSDAWESELVGYYQLIERWRELSSADPSASAPDVPGEAAGLFDGAPRGHRPWIGRLRSARPALPLLRGEHLTALVLETRARGEQHSEFLRSAATAIATNALEFYGAESKAQCARYEGTEGTRVGMTMFYTDLLAKIWESTDYGLAAPVIEIPGFLSTPRIDLDPKFLTSMQETPGTRIWFGARASAVSKTAHGNRSSFYFDHMFSRIYAAGHNPATPGVEVRPGEDSRRTVGWWDRHFEEIASYEPEYHRLNQIMKWALVTAALSESNTARYLGSVAVQRDLRFSDWQQAHRTQLRFSESLPAPTSSPSGRECLPLLSSYWFSTMGSTRGISGGVSSVPRGAIAEVPVAEPSLPLGARRPYVENLGGGTAGTATRARPVVSGEAVEFVEPATTPTRTAGGDIALGTPKITYRAGPLPRTIEIRAGDGARPIGALDAEVTGNQVKLRWTDAKVELERYNAPAVPEDLAGADKLAAEGDLVTAARSYQARVATPPTTATELARETVVQAARRNPAAVLRTVQQLERTGAQLLPEARAGVRHAVSEVGSPRAAAHVASALDQGLPLTNGLGKISVERGRIVLTRDFDSLPTTGLSTKAPTNLSECEVYLDTRLRVGQEGLVPDTGGPAARWQRLSNVRVEQMKATELGALPDRIVTGTTTKTTYDYVPPSATRTTVPTQVIFLRQCDADHRTATTDDDC